MRLRNVPGAREAVAEDPRVVHTPEEARGHWHEIFGNDHPLHVEVGMGKGRFLLTMAARNPEVNYVGVERYESVMIRALKKLDRMEQNGETVPGNLRFLRMDAAEIEAFFSPGEVDRIYLNFSDPWPKDRHAKRRLESREFLARFERILCLGGLIEFKTDNEALYRFALTEQAEAGWELLYSTEDLHGDPEAMRENVMTEYEEKFSAKGNRICKYVTRRP